MYTPNPYRAVLWAVIFFCIPFVSIAQSDSLLNSLLQEADTEQSLLPQKMIPTQRILWGKNGALRITGIAPLDTEKRKKELNLRRNMLTLHQVLGFATLGGMVAQGVVGGQLYNGKFNLRETHEHLGQAVTLTYSLAAAMSLLAPPPLINRDKKVTSLRLHKWLSLVHLSGMIATNVLGSAIEDNPKLKPVHRAVAFTTFASYATAVIVIKF